MIKAFEYQARDLFGMRNPSSESAPVAASLRNRLLRVFFACALRRSDVRSSAAG
ncbi:MAG: hypothetical protein KAS72_07145 [Phycisphaerales bacterium]|nr:hypothetical protein [Phycisphaerales bacterium]